MPITSDDFKKVMRNWASGVTIVTLRAGEATHGLTVSGFVGLSLNPPLVMISVGEQMRSHNLLEEGQCFAINFLRDDQRAIADRFAGRNGEADRFEGVHTRSAVTGAPIFEDCLAWLDCRLIDQHRSGDHIIYIGEVVASNVNGSDKPLLYWNGDYRCII
jgi:flavin reductase (DIM6/NTAB) family NADH-FMN oxidoreductase RutF